MVTAGIIQGQIKTATGLLEWIQAKTEQTRKAWTISPLLLVVNSILSSVVSRVEKEGVENFNLEAAGPASDKFKEVSKDIHRLIALSDKAGLYRHFPCRYGFTKLQAKGKELGTLADELDAIDRHWHQQIADMAQKRIEDARRVFLAMPAEEVVLFDPPEEPSSPSEEAVRRHLQRTLSHK